jgi:aspartate racemase
MSESIIGILGGMGPEATADLFKKIIKNTSAKIDQDHLRIIIDNNPKIPDRTKAILLGGPSPKNILEETAKNLERSGASLIIIPCNTAHNWIEDIRKAVKINVLDMLDETAKEITTKHPQVKRVGLLASSGTITANLYQKRLRRFGIETILPNQSDQNSVMDVIYSVKSGNFGVKDKSIQIAIRMIAQGAQVIIEGCTEIPLVLDKADFSVPLVDPAEILARRAIKAAGGNLTPES